ncbi:Mpv17/PMP22 family protein [Xylaria palmicola]|nr:Mpv17/PMP22 family protein [Xylaria palmicola]
MSWELTRRRIVRTINSKFIFDRIPVLHAVIFFIEMGIIARLASRYNAYFDARPVLTMMVTNAVLGGIADTVAQTITSVTQRARANRKAASGTRDDAISIEIQDMSRKDSRGERDLFADPRSPATPFDFERLTRFMAYGFAMAPIQFKWFGFLSRAFPITKTSAFVPALKRVAVDQIAFAPVSVALFFSVMTVAEGGGRRAVAMKLRDMYMPTLKANYMVWPAVQIVNFRLMPVQFQLPFVSTIGIAWTAYLSLSNASEDETLQHQNVAPYSPNIRLE